MPDENPLNKLKSFYVTTWRDKDEKGKQIFVLVETRTSEMQKTGGYVSLEDVEEMIETKFIHKTKIEGVIKNLDIQCRDECPDEADADRMDETCTKICQIPLDCILLKKLME